MSNTQLWKPAYSISAESKQTKPGCWNVHAVTILGPDGNPVGEYEYNYSMKPPFYAFELEGQWYALYAKDYTASRVMKLPSCEDVWGEDRNTVGFCPVEFFVPARQYVEFGGDRTGRMKGYNRRGYYEDSCFEEPHHNAERDWTVHPVEYADFGFVCGCVWGDDSSWKIQFFDFARIKEGIVTYDSRFGYFEMHDKLRLHESIHIHGDFKDRSKLTIDLFGPPRSFTFDGKEKNKDAKNEI